MKAFLLRAAALCAVLFSGPAWSQEEQSQQKDANVAASEEQPEAFDFDAFAHEYQTLLIQQKIEEAEQKFNDALTKNPGSAELRSLHSLAYSFLRRAGRNEEAFEHLKAAADHQLEMAAEHGRGSENFSRYLAVLVEFASNLGGPDRALALLDEYENRAKEIGDGAGQLVNSIEAQRAIQLAQANRADEAKAIIDKQITGAQQALDQNPDDANAVVAMASARRSRVQLESSIEGGDPDKAWSELLEFLSAKAKEHTDSPEVIDRKSVV